MSIATSSSKLVERAEEILRKAQEFERAQADRPDRERVRVKFWEQTSQLRNMVQIAQAETEVPVLRNFVRYQMGRRSTREFWTLVGEGIIHALQDIEVAAKEEKSPDEVRGRAIRNFFGYLVRHYVYVNETQNPRSSHQQRGQGRERHDRA